MKTAGGVTVRVGVGDAVYVWRQLIPMGFHKDDEDDRRFAYRCMMQTHKMLKPAQPKCSI